MTVNAVPHHHIVPFTADLKGSIAFSLVKP